MNDAAIKTLLATYPRTRPPLTEAHQKVYVEEYKINREGEGKLYRLTQWLEKWGHHQIAKTSTGRSVLELGAGSLNHFPYESDTSEYDCVEPFKALYEDSPHRSRVRSFYDDIRDVPDDRLYERIISVAVLEHLERLPEVVAHSGAHLTNNGVFLAVIPNEGGLLWGASWRCTTGLAYRLRTGLSYKTLMRHEHINDAKEMIGIVQHFFDNVTLKRFPLPFHHFGFFTFIEARSCNADACRLAIEGS